MMTKLTVIPILLLLVLAGNLQAQEFETDFKHAQELARTEGKTILMVFSGSDWCKPCIRLKKEILLSEDFSRYREQQLLILNLDFPYMKKNALSPAQKEHNEALAERYNPEGAFPLVLLLNPDESVAATISYQPGMQTADFVLQIEQNLPKP